MAIQYLLVKSLITEYTEYSLYQDFTVINLCFRNGYPRFPEIKYAQLFLVHNNEVCLSGMRKYCIINIPTLIMRIRKNNGQKMNVKRFMLHSDNQMYEKFLSEVSRGFFMDIAIAYELKIEADENPESPNDLPEEYVSYTNLMSFYFKDPPAFSIRLENNALMQEIMGNPETSSFKDWFINKKIIN